MRKKMGNCCIHFRVDHFAFSLRSVAGSKSDCPDEYESEVELCKEQYDDPGDADMLRMCIDNTNSQCQSCIDECREVRL